jgi:hypothetical protein
VRAALSQVRRRNQEGRKMAHYVQKNEKFKGRYDVPFAGTDFNPNQALNENSQVWATATEVDATGDPISGGAHVTVQQVVPSNNNSVLVRVWVDAVPNQINVRVTLFFEP